MNHTKLIYHLSENQLLFDTIEQKRAVLGNKGLGLLELYSLGIPVPAGFIISTEVCKFYYQKKILPTELDLHKAIRQLEQETGRTFGRGNKPLLVSVRSGSSVSMPGMMDTILNLGLNDETVHSLSEETQSPLFAYDSYRRFIQMYGTIVLKIDAQLFERIWNERLTQTKYEDLSLDALREIIEKYKDLVRKHSDSCLPSDIFVQLKEAVIATFKSWTSPRAITYRNAHNIQHDKGTAVTIQAMKFGNMNKNSGTGVAFTRNPSTGKNEIFGDFMLNAQGEDVVSGTHITMPLSKQLNQPNSSMEAVMPNLFHELTVLSKAIEKHYLDIQDIEFTIENGKLWILQTRSGKRTGTAALTIAKDMVEERLISKKQALMNIDPESLQQLLHPVLKTTEIRINETISSVNPITKGLPASPGAAVGAISMSSKKAEQLKKHGIKTILVRNETSPEDISGMIAAEGILTARGGMTSHAAVVARGMAKPCVCSAEHLYVDSINNKLYIGELEFHEGDIITINGSTGEVFSQELKTEIQTLDQTFFDVMRWADGERKLSIRTNAETVQDVCNAITLGAEGVGLCRTEHMFFNNNRIVDIRSMIILEESAELRKIALQKILSHQTEDFISILKEIRELPFTIRLLDPPLHEFLPSKSDEMQDFAEHVGISVQALERKISELQEHNPMLGHRGCRLAITSPEIYKMQMEAILDASIHLYNANSQTYNGNIEIMFPLVINLQEIQYCLDIWKKLVQEKKEKIGIRSEMWNQILKNFKFGAMIELPAAAINISKIATAVDFLSFGTNDLTQTTLGLSRDDSHSFMQQYIENNILPADPFVTIDKTGPVAAILKTTVLEARKINPNIKLGVCGEHAGDPSSIQFFNDIGLDYISCSPYRIPIARLAAAQAIGIK